MTNFGWRKWRKRQRQRCGSRERDAKIDQKKDWWTLSPLEVPIALVKCHAVAGNSNCLHKNEKRIREKNKKNSIFGSIYPLVYSSVYVNKDNALDFVLLTRWVTD